MSTNLHKKSQENKNDKTKSNSQINDNDKTQNNSHINNNNKDKMINVRQNKTTESKNREQMTLLDNNSPVMISKLPRKINLHRFKT